MKVGSDDESLEKKTAALEKNKKAYFALCSWQPAVTLCWTCFVRGQNKVRWSQAAGQTGGRTIFPFFEH